MKHLILFSLLVICCSFGFRKSYSEDLEYSNSLFQYCDSCGHVIHTYVNRDPSTSSNNVVITRNAVKHGDKYFKPDIGLILIKNDEHFGFGIALVKPLFKLN